MVFMGRNIDVIRQTRGKGDSVDVCVASWHCCLDCVVVFGCFVVVSWLLIVVIAFLPVSGW